MCLEPSESLLVWLEELRTRCEDYEFGLHVVEMCDEYQNLWECSSTGVGAGSQKSLKYADECRVSVLFDEFAEEIRARRPVEVEDAGFNVPADVLDWTTKLLFEYCSEDDDFMEYESRYSESSQTPKGSKAFLNVDEEYNRRTSTTSIRTLPRPKTYHSSNTKKQNGNIDDANVKGLIKVKWNDTTQSLAKNYEFRFTDENRLILKLNADDKKPHVLQNIKNVQISSKKVQFYCLDERYDCTFSDTKCAKDFHEKIAPSSAGTETPSNKIEVMNRLMGLLRKRESREDLEKKRILQNEEFFGNTLVNIMNQYKTRVPKFVRCCAEIVERDKNIETQGIYRTSGNLATIQHIRCKINENKFEVLEQYAQDCDVISGSLKLFFRELKEPLIPDASFEDFLAISESQLSSVQRHEEIMRVINRMHEAHKNTLYFLLRHLYTVSDHHLVNKMTLKSMAIVWGPSLIFYSKKNLKDRSVQEQTTVLMEQSEHNNKVIEMLLTSFSENDHDVRSLASNSSLERDDHNSQDRHTILDAIFGRPLSALKYTNGIPNFLSKIVPKIEKNIKLSHLYSLPYDQAKLEKIKMKVTERKLSYIDKFKTPELVAALLEFFRLLPEPLVSEDIIERYIESDDNRATKQHILDQSFAEMKILEFVMKHLIMVMTKKASNKMSMEKLIPIWIEPLCHDCRKFGEKEMRQFMEGLFSYYHSEVNTSNGNLFAKTDNHKHDNAIVRKQRHSKQLLHWKKKSVYDNNDVV